MNTNDKKVEGIKGLYKRNNGSYKFDRTVQGHRYSETLGPISLERAIHICTKFNLDIEDGMDPIQKSIQQTYPLSKLTKDWLLTKNKKSETTQQRYRAIIDHLNEFLQNPDISVASIDSKVAQQYHSWRCKAKIEEATHYVEITTLRSLFKYAQEKLNLIETNPFLGVDVKKPKYGKHNPLSHEEYELLLQGCILFDQKSRYGTSLRDIVELTVHTGLRLDEIYNLEWKDVDSGTIRVFDKWIKENKTCNIAKSVLPDLRQFIGNRSQEEMLFNSSNVHDFKNRLPIRSPDKLLLLRVKDINLEEGLLHYQNSFYWEPKATMGSIQFHDKVYQLLERLRETKTSNFIFPGNDGGVLTLDLLKALNKAQKLAGIKKTRFHDLRHTFAVWLREAGVDIYTLKGLMRHQNIKDTQQYIRYCPQQSNNAINLI